MATGTMAVSNPIRFSTKYRDNETGLYYYGYRYYSPSLGRWISRDPIDEQGGLNLYGFVNNDPVNYIDPLGKETWVPYPGPGRYISDPPFPGIPPGPGLYDQWNPFNIRADENEADYREWFEWRFPKTIEGAKQIIITNIREKACSKIPRSCTLSGIKGHEYEPKTNIFKDIPQSLVERYVKIGSFNIMVDTVNLEWKNNALFHFKQQCMF